MHDTSHKRKRSDTSSDEEGKEEETEGEEGEMEEEEEGGVDRGTWIARVRVGP